MIKVSGVTNSIGIAEYVIAQIKIQDNHNALVMKMKT